VRPVCSKLHRVGDERLAQAGGDETIPVLVWLDDGAEVNYNKLGKALAHVYPLPTDTIKSHLEQ